MSGLLLIRAPRILLATTLRRRAMSSKVEAGEWKESVPKIRNLGIIAHIDAGKTTTTERMLFYSGFTRRIGDVDDGNTVMDYLKQEKERGITITSAAITLGWNGHKINLIDTPGHVDFTIEVERSIRVLDGAVAIFDAVAGVEAQTETVWRQADRHKVPRIAYINKMDKIGASYEKAVASIRKKLNANPFLIQLPVVDDEGVFLFEVISLPEMELVRWKDASGHQMERIPLRDAQLKPAWLEKAAAKRLELLETLANLDDKLMDQFLESEDPTKISAADVNAAIQRVTISSKGVPVLVGSSFKNRGVQLVLDAVVNYLPSPLQRPPVLAIDVEKKSPPVEFSANDDRNLCALAFKVIHDKQRGSLVFLRVYSGILKNKTPLKNSTKDLTERVTKLLQAYANDYEEIEQVGPGNIAVAVGLAHTATGDTLLPSKEKRRLVLDGMKIPPPVFFRAIEAASLAQEKTLEAALAILKLEDPSFNYSVDPESLQMVVSGMGELHLEIIADKLKNDLKVDAELGPIRISYREALELPTDQPSEHSFTLQKEISGKPQYAELSFLLSPIDSGDNVIEIDIGDRPLPQGINRAGLLAAITQGIQTTFSRGPLMAFPFVGLKVVVTKVGFNKDSTMDGFRVAAFEATRQAFSQFSPILMEPLMKVEVSLPEEHIGSVLSDLTGVRGGSVSNVEPNGPHSTIGAFVPLEQMVGYSNHLRSITSGTGNFTLEFARYEQMPQDKQAALVNPSY